MTTNVLCQEIFKFIDPKFDRKKALGLALAHTHLITLLRAKLLHDKAIGQVDEAKWATIDGQLGFKQQKSKAYVARFGRKRPE